MRFCSVTLGCKVNQYETQAIEGILAARGHMRLSPGAGCDVCIINTCAVTSESAGKSRQAVRRMKKLEPGAIIAVCGCLAQLEPSVISEIGADLIGGAGDRRGFALELEHLFESGAGNTGFGIPDSEFELLPPGSVGGRTRALLKIQDGCDNFCSYCVIPHARGRARSLPPEQAEEYARQLGIQGFLEIVVTGIEISSYGVERSNGRGHGSESRGNAELVDVLRRISAAAPYSRLRLGSLDPGLITEDFCFGLSGIGKLCNHFHLSLQSGCDGTLRRMGRMYSANAAQEAISSLRRHFADCGITADLITGFPGETEAEFEQTLGFIKDAAFSGMHIFPFSPRPGTSAAAMPEQIEKSVRLERARIASTVAADMSRVFRLGQVGKTVEVLFERERGGYWLGHSGNYLEVAVKNGGPKNSMRPVLITGAEGDMVVGELRVES